MQPLQISVDGRVLRFEPHAVVRLGRSIDADVVLAAQAVSRAHAELRPTPQGWLLVDVGSAGGTYVGGRRVTEHPVSGPLQVQLGPAGQGAVLALTPEQAVRAPAPPPLPPQQAGVEVTRMHGVPQGLPGGELTGPDLMVVAEGKEFRYRHPAQVTIGRAPENDIVVDDPAASRQHGRILGVPGGWVFQTAATANTYLDGRPAGPELAFDEVTEIRLGHPVAGERVQLVPILSAEEEVRRIAARRRARGIKKAAVLAGVGVLVLATIGTAVLVSAVGGDDEPADTMLELTSAEADQVKAATVFILGVDLETGGGGSGSGSIVSEDGLIVTNAHVADPQAQGGSPYDAVLVSLTDPDDGYRANPDEVYRAEIVESDGDRDVTVLQVVARVQSLEVNAQGEFDEEPVDPEDLDLPTMEIGDSDDVEQGQEITVFGFPAIANSAGKEEEQDEIEDMFAQVSETGGKVATIVSLDGEDRGVFDVTARITHGNSGGAMVDNDGRLVGVPTRVLSDDTGFSGRVSPIAFLAETLEAAGIDLP